MKHKKWMSAASLQAALILLNLIIVLQAHAALTTLPSISVSSPNDFAKVICKVAGWMFIFLITLSVVFIIVAAYNYMTSAGESEKVSTAHRMIAYTAVAIMVALLAKTVPVVVSGILSTLFSGGSPITSVC